MTYLWNKEKIPMYDESFSDGFMPSLIPYIEKNSKSCIIICPGGGYARKSMDHEGKQIAKHLNSIGVSAFVLDYRVAPYKYPAPVLDGKRAVRYARYLSEEYGYDKNKIGIMGFSAGGHLAGAVGTFDGELGYELQDEIDKQSSRPDFLVLCYPVISFCEYAHRGSFENFSPSPVSRLAFELSVEKNVDKNTPPTFLWHTVGDCGVPVENSLIMASALSRYKVPFEIHTFKDGGHGMGLANGAPYDGTKDFVPDFKHTAFWAENLKNWLESMDCV